MDPRSKTTAKMRSGLLASLLLMLLGLVTACSDGGGGSSSSSDGDGDGGAVSLSLSGGGVDGPLAFATVTLFAIDTSVADFKGQILGEGATDSRAAITGIDKPAAADAPYLLEFTADDDTRDLTACEDLDSSGSIDVATECLAPVVGTLRTIVTAEMLDSDRPVYATLLTTMATDLAIAATFDASGDEAALLTALADAAAQVKSTVGFGLGGDTDIFTTPPILDADTDTAEEQEQVAAYRSAVQALASVVNQIADSVGGADPAQVLTVMTQDLADGEIDGQVDGVTADLFDGDGDGTGDANGANAALVLLDQDPESLPVPNDPLGRTVGDMAAILVDEIEDTGNDSVTTQIDENTEIELKPAEKDPDLDDDGVPNESDAFPNDPTEDTDTDGDGIGNNTDNDDDNDGVADGNDAFPLDPDEKVDTDNDGVGNNADDDDDGDGVLDDDDDFPLDSGASDATDVDADGWAVGQDPDDNDDTNPGIQFVDTDNDGLADSGGLNPDDDDDNDGVADAEDGPGGSFALNPNEQSDQDGDGFGDNSDDDIDGDGRPNHTNGNSVRNDDASVATTTRDRFPRNSNEWADTDRDGIGNNADDDDDNDNVSDTDETAAGTDPLKRDTDGDGALDGVDAFPLLAFASFDLDDDGVPVRPANLSDENVPEGQVFDNCPATPNPEQIDTDSDGKGDKCDTDDDGDGVADSDDAFPLNPAETADADQDGIGDNADPDDDNDGVTDANDAFDTDPTEFEDTDGDGVGNNADDDDDNDGVLDGEDAFPKDATRSSVNDQDNDGWPVGDDPDDNDGNNPGIAYVDADGDGLADNGGLNPDPDDDNDGVPDADDAFPNDPGESVDTDGDGTGNNADTDDDNDGTLDGADAFPLNDQETTDSDQDGIGDNADPDDDNDNIPDGEDSNSTNPDVDGDQVLDGYDNCPLDANTQQKDSDFDGIGDVCDTDKDNDGVNDDVDNCPTVANQDQANVDGDGQGDVCDSDDDGDSVNDAMDNCPLIANGDQLDTDSDNLGNVCDSDDDGDGVEDGGDNCPLISNEDQLDTDQDQSGNVCDLDDDDDGVPDTEDAFPLDASESSDTDGDNVGDNSDNCPAIANQDQLDTDQDTLGNVCDDDDDNDTLTDTEEESLGTDPLLADTDEDSADDAADNCPLDANEDQLDTDQDGAGNVCDSDDDNDGISDEEEDANGTNPLLADSDSDSVDDNVDNCPIDANGDQADNDQDQVGDVCDADDDNDGVDDSTDNCEFVANPNQDDSDGDGIGDACEAPPVAIAGFWLASITAATESETGTLPNGIPLSDVCDIDVGDGHAGVAFIKQQGSNITLVFENDGGDDGDNGTVDGEGNVQFGFQDEGGENEYDYSSGSPVFLYSVVESFSFSGAVDDITTPALITGSSISETFTVFDGEDGSGSQIASCTYTYTGSLTDMAQVDASSVLSTGGTDQGVAFPHADRDYFEPTDVDVYYFGYTQFDSAGSYEYEWNGSAWELFSGSSWMLTSSGWNDFDETPGIDGTPATTFTLARAPGGPYGSQWLVTTYAANITGLNMMEFVGHDWEEGVADPTASFASANARAIGVTVVSQVDEYELGCDYDMPKRGLTSCENWVWKTYPSAGEEAATTDDLATALTDVLHSNGTAPSTPIGGIPVGETWMPTGTSLQLFAWLQGSDVSGAAGTSGSVAFYTHDGMSANSNLVSGVSATWEITDPMGTGDLVLMFTLPQNLEVEHFYYHFEENPNVMIAAVALSDATPYVRVGWFAAPGEQKEYRGLNVTALNELINGFSYSEPDSDSDGVVDTEDNCPADANGDQADSDGNGVGDVCDGGSTPTDSDGDGWNDNEDNCPDVFNSDQADSDGNGIGDACDSGLPLDSDSDGVPDESDAFPNDASEQNDADGDQVGDNSDACPFLAGSNQTAADCADPGVNMAGVYLIEWTGSGTEYDEDTQSCVAITETSGGDLVQVEQIGNQVILRGEDEEGGWEDPGTINANGDFSFTNSDSTSSFSLTGSFVNGSSFNGSYTEEEGSCSESGSVVFTPGTAVQESTVFSSGIAWFESDSWYDAATGQEQRFFEYGLINDSAAESFFEYNASTGSWDELQDSEVDQFITANGLDTALDLYTISGYVSAGETAILSPLQEDGTTVSTLVTSHVELSEFNVEGKPMAVFLSPEFKAGLTQDDVFSTGARAYVATITEQTESYRFWCDDDWNSFVASNYTCANVVATAWQDQNGDGEPDPVAATALNDLVYTPTEFSGGTITSGGLWVGEGWDVGGNFSVNVFLISDDGTTTGANPVAKVVKFYDSAADYWGDKIEIDEISFTVTNLGGIDMVQWDVPDVAAKITELDEYELHPFIFVESSLDGTALVRRGERTLQDMVEVNMVFNTTARDQILAAFNTIAGIYTNTAESVLFTMLPNGMYFGIQWAEANGFIGFERGGYEHFGNELYINTDQNNDGEALFCDASAGTGCSDLMYDVDVSSSALTLFPGTVDEFALDRQALTASGLVGAWHLQDDTVLMMFLPGGEYFAIQWEEVNGFVGFERGTYSLNVDVLTVTVDQNNDGEALICGDAAASCAAQDLPISLNGDQMIIDPSGDAVTFERAL